jgi:hypothetical protein
MGLRRVGPRTAAWSAGSGRSRTVRGSSAGVGLAPLSDSATGGQTATAPRAAPTSRADRVRVGGSIGALDGSGRGGPGGGRRGGPARPAEAGGRSPTSRSGTPVACPGPPVARPHTEPGSVLEEPQEGVLLRPERDRPGSRTGSRGRRLRQRRSQTASVPPDRQRAPDPCLSVSITARAAPGASRGRTPPCPGRVRAGRVPIPSTATRLRPGIGGSAARGDPAARQEPLAGPRRDPDLPVEPGEGGAADAATGASRPECPFENAVRARLVVGFPSHGRDVDQAAA